MILQQNITWKVWPRSCTSHELVHVGLQCHSVDPSVFVRGQQVNSQQVTGLTSEAE